MKFTNGVWFNREGVTVHGATQVTDVRASEKSVTVFAAAKIIENRSMTLNSPLLTIEFSSPLADCLNVKAFHHKGRYPKPPFFNVKNENVNLSANETETEIIISSGKLKAVVEKNPFCVSFFYNDKFLTRSETGQLAFIDDNGAPHMRERLELSVGENIYGLGERFTPLVKNGQSIDMWNDDGGTSSNLAYKNIPFFVSNRGYGVFVNDPGKVSYEIAAEHATKTQFSVSGEQLEYILVGGGSMKRAVANYTDLTGRPTLPPAWSFGLWLTTSFVTDYDEATVNHFVDGMFERGISLSVFHFDCFWMKAWEWCNFEWDREYFCDVQNMLARLKEKGLRICVWINPYIAQKSPLFDEGMERGF
ncbi:MAG: alpha-xylosidase, partial [Defluviitaleaceae bacterium]|nr:alpha-xylosidase [Defluviitaleaceae bacterium]